jgi:hypothetical protein
MQRDWDLIRRLLKKIQDDDRSDVTDVEKPILTEHVRLLTEAGLIESEMTGGKSIVWHRCRLTWQGHDFIESVSNESLYKQAVQKAKAAGSISFEILKTVIAELAKQAIFPTLN